MCHFETALRRVRRSGAPSLSLHAAHPGPYPPSQCLSSIAEQYYDKLQAYMQAIWQLTVKAVTEDSDEVALQALGLWYAIAEYESTELPTGEDGAPVPGFIKQAAHFLVPMLIKQLTKQEEGQEHDEGAWNLSVAGATILDLSAPMVGDAVVELVMPFVQENIAKRASEEDWRWREAATIAFGSILAGPSPQHLVPLVREGLTFLLKSMEAERHSMVLDTTIWAIGRIFEHAHLPDVITPQLPDIVRMLLAALGAEEHLAHKASYALVHLAEGFPSDGPAQNNPMMSFIPHVIGVRRDERVTRAVTPGCDSTLVPGVMSHRVQCTANAAAPLAPSHTMHHLPRACP